MGAVNSTTRTRGDDSCQTLVQIPPQPDQSYGHISKKSKLSVSGLCSVVLRICSNPVSKPRFSREVRAPVQRSRFGGPFYAEGSDNFDVSLSGRMGNCLGIQLLVNNVKNGARKRLKYFLGDDEKVLGNEKEKLVIVIDDADEDGAGVEEVDNFTEDSKGKKLKVVEKDLQSLDSSVVTDVSNGDEEQDDRLVPAHKKLYDFTKKRDGKLSSLDQEIEYNEQRLKQLRILRSQEKLEQIKKDDVEVAFLPLSEEEEKLVDWAFSNSNKRKVLVSHENSSIDITGEKLQCLRPGKWLNDEVVNLYLALLKERERRQPQKFLICHFFNTFFYKKLTGGGKGYNYQSVRRWTTQRKLGYNLLDCEKIFVPIHEDIHWCLGVINVKDKKFQYLDALKGKDYQALDVLAKYYVDEVKDKNGEDVDVSLWEKECVTNSPGQHNLFDCGMFMVKYTDFYSRGIGLCFDQGNMPYFRRRIAKEILLLKAE